MALPRVTIYADGACRKNPGTRWLGGGAYLSRAATVLSEPRAEYNE